LLTAWMAPQTAAPAAAPALDFDYFKGQRPADLPREAAGTRALHFVSRHRNPAAAAAAVAGRHELDGGAVAQELRGGAARGQRRESDAKPPADPSTGRSGRRRSPP